MKQNTPVAITGIGCLCAGGMNLSGCMDYLFQGNRLPAHPINISSDHSVSYPVFEIKEDLISSEEKKITRTCELTLTAALEAFENANLSPENLKGSHVGVCIGTTVGATFNNEVFYRDYHAGLSPETDRVKRFLNSNPASLLSQKYGLTGPRQTVVNACSSGGDALGLAAEWIRTGVCDMVIAGGADELCRVTYNGFISLKITDSEPCRPFDRERQGLNLGEGAAIFILESEDSIKRRKMEARSYILGYGSGCDAYHLTAPIPDGTGLKRSISEAVAASGVSYEDIGFINAHGTGTPDNDKVEALVLSEVFPDIPFCSTKGYTGHTLGAAGAIEAAFTVACLEQDRIPGNIGFAIHDPDLPVSPVKHVTEIKGNVALSESLAFGGNNAVLVLGRMEI